MSTSDLRTPPPPPPVNSDAGAGLQSPYYANASLEGRQRLLTDESGGAGPARNPFRNSKRFSNAPSIEPLFFQAKTPQCLTSSSC